MSGMILPLPEPPADDVDQLQELLRAARGHRQDAEATAERLLLALGEESAGAPVSRERAMYYRTELTAAQYRLKLWESTIGVLEHRARTMGLQP